MSRTILVFGLLGSVVVLSGCNKIADALVKKSMEAQEAAASASAAAAAAVPLTDAQKDGQLATKLEGYIFCLNRETASAFDSKRSYLRTVDEKTGPTGKENHVYLRSLSPESCLERITKAKAMAPPLPEVETAAATYAAALTKLQTTIKPISAYYEQKDFKDDKYAKGKASHASLMAAFEEFSAANKTFDTQVTQLNEQVAQRRLARLEKDPKARLEYLVARTVDNAKKVVDLADIKSLAALDGAAYGAAVANYEKSVQELDTYTSAHKEEANKVSRLNSFQNDSATYLKAAKELMRRKRDDKDFTKESGSPEHMDGHPAQVVKEFNEMIEVSNDLEFRS
jgi:hypothetical protein